MERCFDFETMIDRSGLNSVAADKIPWDVKVDEGVEPIPMWIADMSFVEAPPVIDAIQARLARPTFGYFSLSDDYFNSIISWQARRNGVENLTKEDIGYENGVLGGLASAVSAFTAPGDKILLHSPTYVGFTNTLKDMGRAIVHSQLVRDENGVWRMDYEDMDRKLKDNSIHFAVFCSPHNPCGRVWERWEIEKAMEIYAANDCIVVSDEIWSDIIMPGHKHIPTQSVSEDARNRVIAFYAPSKTFSLAGLIGSFHIIYNKYLRERFDRASGLTHYNSCNVLSMAAAIGAFGEEGEKWADEMIQVIDANFAYACDFISENFPEVKVMRPEGTYILYLDVGDWCDKHGVEFMELCERGVRAGVIWQNGEAFIFPRSIRMNLSLPHAKLVEAFDRLKDKAFV